MFITLFPLTFLAASLALASSHTHDVHNHHRSLPIINSPSVIKKQRSDLTASASESILQERAGRFENWVDVDEDDDDDEIDLDAWGDVDEDDLEDAVAIFDDEEEWVVCPLAFSVDIS